MTYEEAASSLVWRLVECLTPGTWQDYERAKKAILPLVQPSGRDAVCREILRRLEL